VHQILSAELVVVVGHAAFLEHALGELEGADGTVGEDDVGGLVAVVAPARAAEREVPDAKVASGVGIAGERAVAEAARNSSVGQEIGPSGRCSILVD
jgi:hypothetical protein